MRVAVVGAGVIGVTSAYLLARRGYDATLLDSCEQAPLAGSYAIGGQLSYSYVAPLAGPGVLARLPWLLLAGESPVCFQLRLDPRQWRWCANFLLACRKVGGGSHDVAPAGIGRAEPAHPRRAAEP